MEPTNEVLEGIADAMYRYDAPRYGNDVRPFTELGFIERKRFLTYARIAVEKWELARASADVAEGG